MKMRLRFSNLGVGSRLAIAFGLMILIMLAVAAVGTRFSARQLDAMSQAVDVDMKFALHVLEARAALGNLRRYEKDMLLNLASHEKAAAYMKLWREKHREAADHLQAALPLARSDSDRGRLTELAVVLARYQQNMEIVHAGITAAEVGSAEDGYRTVGGFVENVRAADRRLDEIHDAAVARIDAIKPLLE